MNHPSNLSDHLFSRRTALKLLGVGSVAGLIGYSRFSKPQPSIYQPDTIELPQQLQQQKSVVVVGGGLAGLASAYLLSQRGFQVTLLEKAPQLGGKIASWEIEMDGEKFRMEHGFHGFFPQYYNLNSLAEELQIQKNFHSLNFYSLVFKNGEYQPEVFKPSHSAFPWNIIDLAIASPNRLRWGINLTKLSHWQVFRAITGFRIPHTYNRLDQVSVADWVNRDFPQGLYDLYFLPFAKSSLNAPDLLSTGELLQFFHFYFFGNPEGLAFNGTKDDMGTSLVEPIARAIEDRGGKIVTEATVARIDYQGGKIVDLTYQVGAANNSVPVWVEENQHQADQTYQYYGAGDQMYALKRGQDLALSLKCTHQGCTVAKKTDGSGWVCPCHGAEYNSQGNVVKGPARRDLTTYQVLERNNHQIQLAATQSDSTSVKLAADYYIIAADVPGVQQLFNLVQGDLPSSLVQQIDQLAVADPFAVARFWFDRDFDWEHSNFTSLSGYRLTDSITLYHRIQSQFKDWAKRTGGSVVELHAYCYKEAEFKDQTVLLATFEQELYQIVPSLAEARMLHRELVNQKNFSGYPPGSYDSRPCSATTVPNLVLAGDWVKMPFPCGLMERATSSGLLAANEILHQEGLQRRPLLTVNPEGVFKI